jgi:ubiquinone/menaquinone biosynthesis C-methylase UbiE
MKERAKHLLSKWPALFNLAAKVYVNLSHLRFSLIMERVIGTRAREREWATLHYYKSSDLSDKHYDKRDEWVLDYWDSRDHSHRAFLLEKIAGFSPVSSVLEIGCNCGPNLYLVARRFPESRIYGIDINPAAIQKGRELFAGEGITNVTLSVNKADELGQFPDKNFDVVFTDAVLIYIGRDKIRQVITGMVRVARKGLVLLERYDFGPENRDPYGLGVRRHDLWLRNYAILLKQFAPEAQIHITRVNADIWPDKGWQETGAFIEVNLVSGEKETPLHTMKEAAG